MLFSFWYPPTVSCRAAAPSSWKEVKAVTGFSLTQFPVVPYFFFIALNYLFSKVVYVCVCGSACTCLRSNTACVQVGKAQNSHDVFSVLNI